MNKIFFGDNLPILKSLPSESIDLIYIDPPFNTGKTQKLKSIKTIKSTDGDRIGFNGNIYKTFEVGEKYYEDKFDSTQLEEDLPLKNLYKKLLPHASVYFLESFLKPRLIEAHRILKSHGALYFHIDYREVHYCKILLDNIFGRENFLNEIIWAYDFGGRARSKWPAKHDNILYYVKNLKHYTFNPSSVEREDYMAPGLVGPEKATRGKLPTDTWWWGYVGTKGMKYPDVWWNTIVGTNSKDRLGYPTQKPQELIDRIISASTLEGDIVLDFFAGSGTVGASCINNNREFILIDNNKQAIDVMAKRFAGIASIDWINCPQPPKLKQDNTDQIIPEFLSNVYEKNPSFTDDFRKLVTIMPKFQKSREEFSDVWKNSPFEWLTHLPSKSKSTIARNIVIDLFTQNNISLSRKKGSKEIFSIMGIDVSFKFSTLWADAFSFQQIYKDGPNFILCFGIAPFDGKFWVIPKKIAMEHGNAQHKGTNNDYWLSIQYPNIPDWLMPFGGSFNSLQNLLPTIFASKQHE